MKRINSGMVVMAADFNQLIMLTQKINNLETKLSITVAEDSKFVITDELNGWKSMFLKLGRRYYNNFTLDYDIICSYVCDEQSYRNQSNIRKNFSFPFLKKSGLLRVENYDDEYCYFNYSDDNLNNYQAEYETLIFKGF